jgi:hypothetical protein
MAAACRSSQLGYAPDQILDAGIANEKSDLVGAIPDLERKSGNGSAHLLDPPR